MSKTSMTIDNHLNILGGIAITLLLVGHLTNIYAPFNRLIFAIHLPLFFYISARKWDYTEKNKHWKLFKLEKTVKAFIIAILVSWILYTIKYLSIEGGSFPNIDLEITTITHQVIKPNIVLWYFFPLIILLSLNIVTTSLTKTIIIYLSIIAITQSLPTASDMLYLKSFLLLYPFYFAGTKAAQSILIQISHFQIVKFSTFFIAFVYLALNAYSIDKVDLRISYTNLSVWIFIPGCLASILALEALTRRVIPFIPNSINQILEILNSYSLIIFTTHMLLYSAMSSFNDVSGYFNEYELNLAKITTALILYLSIAKVKRGFLK